MSQGLSIVIVSYKNRKVLTDCLDSVFAMNDIGDALQVIVVEQSPEDDIYHFLLSHYPLVDTIRAENKGFGAGNNRGVEIAKHDYLLFLNPDTILTEPIASFAIHKFQNNPKLGLFGVQLLNGDGTKGSSFQCIVPYGLQAKIMHKYASTTGRFFANSMYIEGADMFVRKDLFLATGGFDESVFMYCEEPNLCLGIQKLGYTVGYDGSKKIIHLQGACSPDKYGMTFERQLTAFKKLCDKHGMSFDKILETECRYQKMKRYLLGFLKRKDHASYKVADEKIRIIEKQSIL